jgi:predicted ABC-type ATPase
LPILTIIGGPNGSGKSTLTAAEDFEGRENLVDPDAIAKRLNPFNPAAAAVAAGRESIGLWRKYIADQVSFAIETTLAGKATITLIEDAKAAGFRTRLLYIALERPALNVERVRSRVSSGGHHVPDEDVFRRYERSIALVQTALRLVDEGAVFDNSGYGHKKTLEIRKGVVTWRATDLPDWVRELDRQLSGE